MLKTCYNKQVLWQTSQHTSGKADLSYFTGAKSIPNGKADPLNSAELL